MSQRQRGKKRDTKKGKKKKTCPEDTREKGGSDREGGQRIFILAMKSKDKRINRRGGEENL